MTLILLMMVGCPTLYDSQRQMSAHRHYYRTPNEETKRVLEEVKQRDRREIWICEFVMLGKTFKGLTDATLAWQTQRLRELATTETDWVVHVRPELVVEIAFDGLQKSPHYPGGLALRFVENCFEPGGSLGRSL